jgi:transcription antitermination factor NusG
MNLEAVSNSRWFALRVKPQSEKIVAKIAHNKEFDEFLPLYRCNQRRLDRGKAVELPVLPGYVSCNLNPEHRLPLLTIPGVHYLVVVGKTPVPIDDDEISAIQAATRFGLPTEPWLRRRNRSTAG